MMDVTLLFVSGSFFTQLCLFEKYTTREFIRILCSQFLVLTEQILYTQLSVNYSDTLVIITAIFWSLAQLSISYLFFNRIGAFYNIGTKLQHTNTALFIFAILFNIGDSTSWASYALSQYTSDMWRFCLAAFDIAAALMITLQEILSFRVLASSYRRNEGMNILTARCLHLAVATTSIALNLYDMYMFGTGQFVQATNFNEMNLSLKLISYMLFYNILKRTSKTFPGNASSRTAGVSEKALSSPVSEVPPTVRGTPDLEYGQRRGTPDLEHL
ncbi:hypothetical protein HK102_013923 [Quaeritorhiza haematococci]|nr:hypothetical protein HK102_013923 [Quaeritorhiza haematococci]